MTLRAMVDQQQDGVTWCRGERGPELIEDQDQWWLPGLHRSVELLSEPPVRLADFAPSSPVSPPMARPACWGAIDVRVNGEGIRADCSRWT